MTRKEWDARWLLEYDSMWMETRDHKKACDYAQNMMVHTFGQRPDGDLGPPLTAQIVAHWNGIPMPTLKSVWTWFDGKKLVFGAIIDLASSVALALPAILPAFGLEAAVVAQIVSKALLVTGLLHKFYKFVYREEHP